MTKQQQQQPNVNDYNFFAPPLFCCRVFQSDEEGGRNGTANRRGDSQEAARDQAMAKVRGRQREHPT